MDIPLKSWSNLIPFQSASDIEVSLAEALNKSVCMIRFYAYRMGVELALGRPLTKREQMKLGRKVYDSFPNLRKGRQYRQYHKKPYVSGSIE